jgi:hypothetical protein
VGMTACAGMLLCVALWDFGWVCGWVVLWVGVSLPHHVRNESGTPASMTTAATIHSDTLFSPAMNLQQAGQHQPSIMEGAPWQGCLWET